MGVLGGQQFNFLNMVISDGIFIRSPGSCHGVGLGGTVGVGVIFYDIQPDLVCELLTLRTHGTADILGSAPPGAFWRAKRSNIIKSQ